MKRILLFWLFVILIIPECINKNSSYKERESSLWESLFTDNLIQFRQYFSPEDDLSSDFHDGRSLLMQAAAQGASRILAFLLEQEINLQKQDPYGRTAIDYATINNQEVCRKLLSAHFHKNKKTGYPLVTSQVKICALKEKDVLNTLFASDQKFPAQERDLANLFLILKRENQIFISHNNREYGPFNQVVSLVQDRTRSRYAFITQNGQSYFLATDTGKQYGPYNSLHNVYFDEKTAAWIYFASPETNLYYFFSNGSKIGTNLLFVTNIYDNPAGLISFQVTGADNFSYIYQGDGAVYGPYPAISGFQYMADKKNFQFINQLTIPATSREYADYRVSDTEYVSPYVYYLSQSNGKSRGPFSNITATPPCYLVTTPKGAYIITSTGKELGPYSGLKLLHASYQDQDIIYQYQANDKYYIARNERVYGPFDFIFRDLPAENADDYLVAGGTNRIPAVDTDYRLIRLDGKTWGPFKRIEQLYRLPVSGKIFFRGYTANSSTSEACYLITETGLEKLQARCNAIYIPTSPSTSSYAGEVVFSGDSPLYFILNYRDIFGPYNDITTYALKSAYPVEIAYLLQKGNREYILTTSGHAFGPFKKVYSFKYFKAAGAFGFLVKKPDNQIAIFLDNGKEISGLKMNASGAKLYLQNVAPDLKDYIVFSRYQKNENAEIKTFYHSKSGMHIAPTSGLHLNVSLFDYSDEEERFVFRGEKYVFSKANDVQAPFFAIKEVVINQAGTRYAYIAQSSRSGKYQYFIYDSELNRYGPYNMVYDIGFAPDGSTLLFRYSDTKHKSYLFIEGHSPILNAGIYKTGKAITGYISGETLNLFVADGNTHSLTGNFGTPVFSHDYSNFAYIQKEKNEKQEYFFVVTGKGLKLGPYLSVQDLQYLVNGKLFFMYSQKYGRDLYLEGQIYQRLAGEIAPGKPYILTPGGEVICYTKGYYGNSVWVGEYLYSNAVLLPQLNTAQLLYWFTQQETTVYLHTLNLIKNY